ncbi:MAG: 4-hydroxy-tetrahydrodipicolinate reductase [Candidatus Omnitrophota bacterium]|jgi:4-hydroxy-tetrahydrodipicolinate reductase
MIKICVSGAKGKMGARIVDLAKEDGELELAAEFDIGDDAEGSIAKSDCLIDFTAPDATMVNLAICEKQKKAIVIGTTGLTDTEKARVKAASASIPVVFSPNMSVGVNVLFKIVQDAARLLGPEYSTQILEAHHINKKDAPSGTAKELARIIKDATGSHDVPIESIREDEIVGEHTVTFESPFDIIELTHSAKTRDIFAKGALEAAKFAVTKKNGLYTMNEVLGIS